MTSPDIKKFDYNQEKTARDFLKIIFRHKWVIVTIFVSVVTSVYIALQLQTPIYEAKVKMLISAEKQVDSPFYRELQGNNRTHKALTQSQIVKSGPVLDRAVRTFRSYIFPLDYEKKFSSVLKAKMIESKVKRTKAKIAHLPLKQKQEIIFRKVVSNIRSRIKVEPIRNTNMFTISAQDYSAHEAAKIANVVSRSYVIFDLEQQMAELSLKYGEKHPSVNQINDYIKNMEDHLTDKNLTNLDAIGPASVKIIEQATTPLKPIGSSKKIPLILSMIMSLILGVIVTFLIEAMDQTIKSPLEVAQYLQMPVLGSIMKKRFLNRLIIKSVRGRSDYAQSYQRLCDQLYLSIKEKGIKTIMITSTLNDEGVSSILSNLGLFLSDKLSQKVLILDANLRDSTLNKYFKIKKNSSGVVDLVEGKNKFDETVIKINDHLDILASGKTEKDPIIFLDHDGMKTLIKKARNIYDIVLVDVPNLREYQDAAMLTMSIDGVILVVSEGMSRRHVIAQSLDGLKKQNANLIGAILNNRTHPIPEYIYKWV